MKDDYAHVNVPYWDIDAIAAEVGMTGNDLLEKSALAELTDDRLPPDAAEREGLLQYRSWNNQGAQLPEGPFTIRRGDPAMTAPLMAPAGAAGYRYIGGSQPEGVSIEADQIRIQPHQKIRLTRLR